MLRQRENICMSSLIPSQPAIDEQIDRLGRLNMKLITLHVSRGGGGAKSWIDLPRGFYPF